MFLNFKMNEGDVCLADCATTHTILREKIYFFNVITTNTSVSTISGTSNLIEGSGTANIVLPNGTRFHINDALYSSKSRRKLLSFHPCAHNLLRSHYFKVPVPLLGLFVHFVSLQGFGFQYLTLHGHFAFHLFSASGELCILTQWVSHASSVF